MLPLGASARGGTPAPPWPTLSGPLWLTDTRQLATNLASKCARSAPPCHVQGRQHCVGRTQRRCCQEVRCGGGLRLMPSCHNLRACLDVCHGSSSMERVACSCGGGGKRRVQWFREVQPTPACFRPLFQTLNRHAPPWQVRPGGLVPRVAHPPRARVLLQLHRLPGGAQLSHFFSYTGPVLEPAPGFDPGRASGTRASEPA